MSTNWLEEDFVAAFALLASLQFHNKKYHVTVGSFSSGAEIPESSVRKCLADQQEILFVAFSGGHYALLHIIPSKQEILVYDGLKLPVSRWEGCATKVLCRYGHTGVAGKDWSLVLKMVFPQSDGHNCASIGCGVLWKLLSDDQFDLMSYKERAQDLRACVMKQLRAWIYESQDVLYYNLQATNKHLNFTGFYEEIGVAASEEAQSVPEDLYAHVADSPSPLASPAVVKETGKKRENPVVLEEDYTSSPRRSKRRQNRDPSYGTLGK